MALFNPSTIAWNSAVQIVADSAGVSADSEMTQRAHRSLRAAFQFLGGKQRWDFLRVEAAPISVIAPFSITGISASAGVASAAAPAGHGFLVDDYILGSGLIQGMRVSATAAGGIGLATAISGLAAGVNVITATGVRDFYDLPSDTRGIYTVRLSSSNKPLQYAGRRFYDRTVADEVASSTPSHYDLFSQGAKGKIRLLPPPGGAGVLQIRYYKRFFLASASAMTSALDILEDYEETPIAWAKWHFLTDKGEGRKDQANTWLSLSQEGLKSMVSEQSNLPDEDLVIMPGYVGGWPNVNDTRALDWSYS